MDRQQLGHAVWLASVPLWFLLSYLVLVVLTPRLYGLHRRMGLAVPAVLVVLVAVADLLRRGLDMPIVGQSTYLFAGGHLRKVFTKLGITSRRQLHKVLADTEIHHA